MKPECSNASIFDECAGEVLGHNGPLDVTPDVPVEPQVTPQRTIPLPAVRLPLYAIEHTHLAPLAELKRPARAEPARSCPTHGSYHGATCQACEKYQLGRKKRWAEAAEAFWSIQV
jgi:hypothetical protein